MRLNHQDVLEDQEMNEVLDYEDVRGKLCIWV